MAGTRFAFLRARGFFLRFRVGLEPALSIWLTSSSSDSVAVASAPPNQLTSVAHITWTCTHQAHTQRIARFGGWQVFLGRHDLAALLQLLPQPVTKYLVAAWT